MRIFSVLVCLLAACGARIGGDDSDDNSARPDASISRSPDAGMQQQQPDAAPVVMDNACGVAQNQGDLGNLTGFAGTQLQDGSTTQRIRWVGSETAATANQASPDVLYVELWDGFGAFTGGAARTGTFTISGNETDLDTCGVCVMMLANVTNNTPAKTLVATSGTVTITSVGTTAGQMTQATVTNASFTEVTCNQTNGCTNVAGSTCTSPISHGDVRGTL
ncbi:MAG TPA: hypothetical protein VMZ53_16965 [Kofleriaceae bacterium]|nr:hypothetical protein [Kofleriaceae bacterium]